MFSKSKEEVRLVISPSRAEFSQLAKSRKYVPVTLEMQGDLETPINLFMKLAKQPNSYLLESVEGGEKWARYSYIGRNPIATIQAWGNKVSITDRDGTISEQTGDSLAIIKEYLARYQVVEVPGLPDFFGGAVGYIGYDTIRNYERLPNENADTLEMPDIHLLVSDEVIVYDHLRQTIQLIALSAPRCDEELAYQQICARLTALREEIRQAKIPDFEVIDKPKARTDGYSSTETKHSYMEKVKQVKDYIKQGDVFQVVLSQRLSVETTIDPLSVYRSLRTLNPSPYLFFIDYGDCQLVGASPELLVKVKRDRVETCPIAGTRSRGANPIEDQALAQELLADEKERAEHLMLVDLGRNDLGKISQFGTVETKNLMHIEKYSHVMHIVTNVVGTLRPDQSMYTALQACLPAGTVSGAPKVRAMEIIDEMETEKRGVYAGAVGYLGFNGNMDVCITIRTFVFKDGIAHVQAGAGVVADSNPESEYEETLRKARALLEALRRAEQGNAEEELA